MRLTAANARSPLRRETKKTVRATHDKEKGGVRNPGGLGKSVCHPDKIPNRGQCIASQLSHIDRGQDERTFIPPFPPAASAFVALRAIAIYQAVRVDVAGPRIRQVRLQSAEVGGQGPEV